MVGAKGAGKSTIINLLSRFYDIDSGDIKIDGKSIYSLKMTNMRSHIAVVLQDVFLFNTNIYDNIILGNKDIGLDEVKRAAKEIGIHDFIEIIPYGYFTYVNYSGSNILLSKKDIGLYE